MFEQFIAARRRFLNVSMEELARSLRSSDTTVRKYLAIEDPRLPHHGKYTDSAKAMRDAIARRLEFKDWRDMADAFHDKDPERRPLGDDLVADVLRKLVNDPQRCRRVMNKLGRDFIYRLGGELMRVEVPTYEDLAKSTRSTS